MVRASSRNFAAVVASRLRTQPVQFPMVAPCVRVPLETPHRHLVSSQIAALTRGPNPDGPFAAPFGPGWPTPSPSSASLAWDAERVALQQRVCELKEELAAAQTRAMCLEGERESAAHEAEAMAAAAHELRGHLADACKARDAYAQRMWELTSARDALDQEREALQCRALLLHRQLAVIAAQAEAKQGELAVAVNARESDAVRMHELEGEIADLKAQAFSAPPFDFFGATGFGAETHGLPDSAAVVPIRTTSRGTRWAVGARRYTPGGAVSRVTWTYDVAMHSYGQPRRDFFIGICDATASNMRTASDVTSLAGRTGWHSESGVSMKDGEQGWFTKHAFSRHGERITVTLDLHANTLQLSVAGGGSWTLKDLQLDPAHAYSACVCLSNAQIISLKMAAATTTLKPPTAARPESASHMSAAAESSNCQETHHTHTSPAQCTAPAEQCHESAGELEPCTGEATVGFGRRFRRRCFGGGADAFDAPFGLPVLQMAGPGEELLDEFARHVRRATAARFLHGP